jgi:DNA-binding Lrp family transcriptional regulator
MAPEAYVLIDTEMGAEDDIVKKVREIEGVTSVNRIYGVHDIISKVKAPTVEGVKSIVEYKIRKLDCCRSALTMFIVEK